MTTPTFWNQILIWPITNVLIAFYKFFEWLHIPWPLGWALIAMTVFIRILLYPLIHTQLKSAKKMSDLKPQIDALATKHKDNKQALQQAQLELYKQHGINPAAGCLPLLIQMPVMIALYNVFYRLLTINNMATIIADINHIVYIPLLKLTRLDLSFFGTNLAVKPSEWQNHGWWLLSIPLLTGLLQWWQTRLMTPNPPSAVTDSQNFVRQTAAEEKSKVSPSTKLRTSIQKPNVPDENKKDGKPEDTAAEMQKQMAFITPIMFGYFAFQFPLGLALYWNVSGLFGIMQQLRINKAK